LWRLATAEDFHNAHRPAAFRARFSKCERNDLGGWRVSLFGRFRPEQCADLGNIGLAACAGEQNLLSID
jgi:hypothetical protein